MHVVPVYDFSSVTKLLLQWDKAAQRLEIQEGLYQKTGVRPTMRTGFLGLCGTRVDSIEHLQKVGLDDERRRVLRGARDPRARADELEREARREDGQVLAHVLELVRLRGGGGEAVGELRRVARGTCRQARRRSAP